MLVFTQAFLACDPPNPPPTTPSAAREVYKNQGWTVRLSDTGERVTSLVGGRSTPFAGTPAERASQFLRENQLLLGLEQSNLTDLKVLEVRDSPFGANVEFQQVFKGLPVENGRIKINFDKEGRVLHVISSYTPTAGSSDRADRSRNDAAETAIAEFLRTTPIYVSKLDEQEQTNAVFVGRADMKFAQQAKVDDTYFVRNDRLRRAFKTFISAVKPFGIKEIITDAQDGAVLQVRDFVYTYTDGEGQVFKPNPVNSKNDPSLRDNVPLPFHNPNPYYTVPLMELDVPTSGPFKLQGPFVVLQHIEAPPNTPISEDANGKYIFERNDGRFEYVMVYYHIDRIQRYIQSLGFMDIMNAQLAVDAHGNDGVDNSHYVGSSSSSIGRPYIAFGDGGVDDAEDGDAIAHEYGHAMQDNQAPGKYGILNKQTKAMGEGFGDYWAVSSFRVETQESGHALPCVMEWDKVLNTCLRRVDTGLTANDFKSSASHHLNGRIWSATLFDIFNRFYDKADADKLILQSHFNVPDGPSFMDGADAILTADWQLFGGSHITELCQVFTGRKIYGYSDCSSRPAATGSVSTPSVIRLPFTYFPL